MIVWILIIVFLGVGSFALRGAIKNSFKNVELRNYKARMARSILGEKGYRYFVGALGVGFIAAGLVLIVIITGGKSLFNNPNAKTDVIEILLIPADSTIGKETLWTKESNLKITYEVLGDAEFDKYRHISFKNNYRSKFPDLLWKMKNLESIDLTNNEFTELPLSELIKLPGLKKLILDGNPLEQAYMQQVKSKLIGIDVVRNEVLNP